MKAAYSLLITIILTSSAFATTPKCKKVLNEISLLEEAEQQFSKDEKISRSIKNDNLDILENAHVSTEKQIDHEIKKKKKIKERNKKVADNAYLSSEKQIDHEVKKIKKIKERNKKIADNAYLSSEKQIDHEIKKKKKTKERNEQIADKAYSSTERSIRDEEIKRDQLIKDKHSLAKKLLLEAEESADDFKKDVLHYVTDETRHLKSRSHAFDMNTWSSLSLRSYLDFFNHLEGGQLKKKQHIFSLRRYLNQALGANDSSNTHTFTIIRALNWFIDDSSNSSIFMLDNLMKVLKSDQESMSIKVLDKNGELHNYKELSLNQSEDFIEYVQGSDITTMQNDTIFLKFLDLKSDDEIIIDLQNIL